jgi:hypothetical protein
MNRDELPTSGLVFWAVGNGDSTTILVDDEVIIQVDLNHMTLAEDQDDPHVAVLHELIELLPRRDGHPYLSVFVLTHPDLDHCRGFEKLLSLVVIGEIWLTPRPFRDYDEDLCDDAVAFCDEARRRVQLAIKNGAVLDPGDRIRLIGHDELLLEEDYAGFPDELRTVPGGVITTVDGIDRSDVFRAFVHSPFKDDCAGERNDTSLGLQVTLSNGTSDLRALLLGDLAYPTVQRIFDRSASPDLAFDVLLAPHHSSRKVLFWPTGDDPDQDILQTGLLDDLADAAEPGAYIVSSSKEFPTVDKPHSNPPHRSARNEYETIIEPDHFLCTAEHGEPEHPDPIIFNVDDGYCEATTAAGSGRGLAMAAIAGLGLGVAGLGAAVARSRGTGRPPARPHGFG